MSDGMGAEAAGSRVRRWVIWLGAGVIAGLIAGFAVGLARPRVRA